MAVAGTTMTSCPDEYPVEINAHCYFISNSSIVFKEARESCQDMGGDLARIYDLSLVSIQSFSNVILDTLGSGEDDKTASSTPTTASSPSTTIATEVTNKIFTSTITSASELPVTLEQITTTDSVTPTTTETTTTPSSTTSIQASTSTTTHLTTTTANMDPESTCIWYKYVTESLDEQKLQLHENFLEHRDSLNRFECLRHCLSNPVCNNSVVFDQTSCYLVSDLQVADVREGSGKVGVVYTKLENSCLL
ncbi:hypothetical protein EB796_021390 [Bugula neritina]|uniref:Apple domain-containing protein n=1 Tax=Bugula neritina TaxID=10212 RepID=A0A7J7J2L0_BUGNE|nr:hypothetical protein EB796_021390 [Bugula neritina]